MLEKVQSMRRPSTLSPIRRLRLKAVANSKDSLSFANNQTNMEEKLTKLNIQDTIICNKSSSPVGTPSKEIIMDFNNNDNNKCLNKSAENIKPQNNSLLSPLKVHDIGIPRKTQRSVSIHSGVLPTPDSNILRDCASGKIYKRGKLLGKGGFARVYEGTEMGTNKKIAIKVIDKSRVVRSPQREKVNLEIELHRYLATGHPNVVHFDNSFESGKNICLILELCERKSVAQYLRNKDMLSEKEVSDIMYGVIAGVSHLHNADVVHRDLKLGNLLLSEDMTVKVGDFGLATRSTWAKKKTICGTPNFIAPEVLMRLGHGPESDIWAIGCIMYTLLVGKSPFEAASLGETYRRILKNKFRIPSSVSLEAADLIKSMLRLKPHTRPTVFELSKHPFFVKNQTQLRFPSTEILTKKFAPDIPSDLEAQYPSLRRHRASTPSIMSSQGHKSVRHVSCPTTSYYYDGNSSYNSRKASINPSEQGASSSSQNVMSDNTHADTRKSSHEQAASLENIEIRIAQQTPRCNLARRNTVAVPTQQPQVEKKTQAWKFIEKCVNKGTKITTGSPIKKIASKLQKLKTPKSSPPQTTVPPVNQPTVAEKVAKPTWITKWVDYSNRYGFGYQLDDGRICVLFNDGDHIALLCDGENVEYIKSSTNQTFVFPLVSPPQEFLKITKILAHFVTYMTKNLEEAHKATAPTSNARLVTWSRTNLFVAMYLSDGTLQVNFCKDHVKINISSLNNSKDIKVTYMDENRQKTSYGINDIARLAAQSDIVDRLTLVHDEFHMLLPECDCTREAFCQLYRPLTNDVTACPAPITAH